MNNENNRIEYQSPQITVTFVGNDVITLSEDKISWEGPIVGG